MSTMNLCAVDLGNSSGRVVKAHYDGARVKLDEVHRFPNGAIPLGNHLKWDFVHVFKETVIGVLKAGEIASIGIDSWAIDFGLLDESGDLLLVPHHHRDPRSVRAMALFDTPAKQLSWYATTGIAFQPINTSLQLLSMVRDERAALRCASSLLMIADLVVYYLTGEKASEATNASTTQLISLSTGNWDSGIIEEIGVPRDFFQEIVHPGTGMGRIRPQLRNTFALSANPQVITVGSHDTASAIHAARLSGNDCAVISSGTWSLMGTVLDAPVVTSQAMELRYNNERATDGRIRFLKNIMGMWIIEEILRIWEIQDGRRMAYGDICEEAKKAAPFCATFTPNLARFYNPENMVREIEKYLAESGQAEVARKGELIRIVLEGLAFAYREALEQLAEIVGKKFDSINIIGGGSRNFLLNQFTADVCGVPVIAGPDEAAAVGNILSQLESHGEIGSSRDRIALVEASFQIQTYDPHPSEQWEEEYRKYLAIADSERTAS